VRGTLVFHILVDLLMAGGAQPSLRPGRMIDLRGQVRVMAGDAILNGHGIGMGLMALETGQDFGMALMTGAATHLRVRARHDLVRFRHGIVVATQAGVVSLRHLIPELVEGGVCRMAAAAVGQFVMGIVGCCMTIGAGRNRILCRGMALVAVCTTHPCTVPSAEFGQSGVNFAVAGGTVFAGDVAFERDVLRIMGAVALLTAALGHLLGVGFMAVQAEGAMPVLQMAVIAGNLGVAAAGRYDLLLNAGVAGEAGRRQVGWRIGAALMRRMGLVAVEAVVQGEVGILFRGMALRAGRGGASLERGVLLMTAVAADLLLVSAAFLLQGRDCFLVAGGAPGLGNACKIADRNRLVSTVTGPAIILCHGVVVRAVAIGAGRDLVMLRVAGVAGHIGVSAADGVRPLCRPGMTACTGCTNVLKG